MHVKSHPACVPECVEEYRSLIQSIGQEPGGEQLRAALVQQADQAEHEAAVVEMLARQYGTAVLANCVALAEAMEIEDCGAEL